MRSLQQLCIIRLICEYYKCGSISRNVYIAWGALPDLSLLVDSWKSIARVDSHVWEVWRLGPFRGYRWIFDTNKKTLEAFF